MNTTPFSSPASAERTRHWRACAIRRARHAMPWLALTSALILLPLTVVATKTVPTKAARTAVCQASLRCDVLARARGIVEVEGGLTRLATDTSGIVQTLHVKEGQRVAQGDALLTLDTRHATRAVQLADAAWRAARARAAADAADVAPARQRAQRFAAALKQGGVEGQAADDAQAGLRHALRDAEASQLALEMAALTRAMAQADFDARIIRAPHAGEVLRLHVAEGSAVRGMDHTLMVLLPERRLQVRAEINEYFLARVHPGQAVEVGLPPDAGGARLAASVGRIDSAYRDSVLGPSAEGGVRRVVDAIIELPDSAAWRVGQQVEITFHEQEK